MDKKEMLTRGLQEGFGGETTRKSVARGGFTLESSHYETKDGNTYHDEWMADRVGGGQELVEVDGKRFTRVYAGGTISEEALKDFGLTKKDVISFLKKNILENGDKIRLQGNFQPEAEGDWQYKYNVIDREESIPVTVGKEHIYYKGELVFVHNFIISPIE
ncbi:hypothetical protein KKH23_00905 [Patescibacteria group bacterium]|nr:hypothetical protein [Patescibacteria group bacterium]MBU0777051.1 hypothetical protein [Patescibacteria group bacterium]MBU0845745.1 hypothetical protein [Patescibacteria group bacterium]MBU0923205.1 hypothetical protein [Patescibacteria group bacterium]MBU1066495.1 hypothetical protein [Patescibacteria group bacterium]